MRSTAVLLIGLGCLGTGCLPDGTEPIGPLPPPPPSCGDRVCQPSLDESSLNCPGDCPYCWATTAKDPSLDWASGVTDGRSVEVGPVQQLNLYFGREIRQAPVPGDQPDVELIGEVAGSAPPLPEGCPVFGPEHLFGAVRVLASDNELSGWQLIGLWTQQGANRFDLACSSVLDARWIRLESLEGASFRLDAAHALYCPPE